MPGAYDLIVVGAGPAGLAAAITARALRLHTLVVDAGEQPGGQLRHNPTAILDCPGLVAPTGDALAQQLLQHLARLGGEVRRASVDRIDVANATVHLQGAALSASAILLATGASCRRLGVPGEAATPGRGLSPVARQHGHALAGRPVVVVGGGDVAHEEAALLARVCPQVTLIHRGEAVHARPDFRAAVAAEPNISLLLHTHLVEIHGAPDVAAVTVASPAGYHRINTAAVVIAVGQAPHSELVADQVKRDEHGGVIVDRHQRSSAPRLYAAGDVCSGSQWTVVSAIGQASVAVKDLERRIAADEFPAHLQPGSVFASGTLDTP